MSIAAGDLNRRITIQRRTGGKDESGQPIDTWTEVVSVWSKIKGQAGLKAIYQAQGNVATSITQYSIRIRYRLGLTAGMRVLEHGPDGLPDESAPFNVISIQMDKEGREWTDLVCQLGGNNG